MQAGLRHGRRPRESGTQTQALTLQPSRCPELGPRLMASGSRDPMPAGRPPAAARLSRNVIGPSVAATGSMLSVACALPVRRSCSRLVGLGLGSWAP